MKKTTDLWLTTYIIMQGHPLADYNKIGPRKVEFGFDLSDDDWKKYKLQYLKSDYAKFEQEMAKLRELNYG